MRKRVDFIKFSAFDQHFYPKGGSHFLVLPPPSQIRELRRRGEVQFFIWGEGETLMKHVRRIQTQVEPHFLPSHSAALGADLAIL